MKRKNFFKNCVTITALVLALGSALIITGTGTVWGEYDVPFVPQHWVDIEDEELNPSGWSHPAGGTPGSKVEIEAYYPDEGKAFSHWERRNSEGTIGNVQAIKTWFKFDDEREDKLHTLTVIYRKILVGDIPDQVYTGKAITPDVGNVELEGIDGVLVKGLDYKVEYKNNTAVGTATARIEIYYGDREGPCKGHIIKTFKIVRPEDFTRAEVDVENKVYTGKAIKPPIEVRWKGRKLKEGVDYTMSYKNNVNVGTVIVRLTGKGNFTGIVDTSFDITKRPVTITVANASKVEGRADPAFKGTVRGLAKSGDLGRITYKRIGNAAKPGTYKGVLTASYKANPNYKVTVKKGNFTIKADAFGPWMKLNATQHRRVSKYDKSRVQKANHLWDNGKVTKRSTTIAPGVRTYTCTVCKATRTEAIPKLKPVEPKPKPKPTPKVSGTPLVKMMPNGKRGMTISWNKIQGVAGYDVFFAECGHESKNIKSLSGNNTVSLTVTGLRGGTPYKACVKAYVIKNGRKVYVRSSPAVHAYTSGSRYYTNVKSVNVNVSSLDLQKGKAYTIKANVVKGDRNKILMPPSHAPILRYMSSNNYIASVDGNGKITAKGKGTCYIYALAHNGSAKQVRVTVK